MMKYLFLSCCVFLLFWGSGFAQENNVWAFGYGAGVDFNSGSPVAISTSIHAREGTASVSDASGQLLFYTEGYTVWDKNGNPMPNGTNLTPFASQLIPSPTASTVQGSIIIPFPGKDSLYYIFSMTCIELGSSALRLYYSVVNINANGGLGDVIPGQKCILVDSMLSERMTAVVGDWCNIWLLTSTASGPAIKAFEITVNGLNTTPVISPAAPGTALAGTVGTLKVSPNGHRLVATLFGDLNGLTVFDFNNGIATNPMNINAPFMSGAYGVEFSPDNSKVYTTDFFLVQYDLSSNNADTIKASRTIINNTPTAQLKLGPDGKIYFIGNGTALSRIPFPNLPGTACGYEANIVPILGSASLGLPNVVPVMPVDTVRSSQVIKGGCFATEQVLQAQHPSGTWGYLWNNGATTSLFAASTPGTYWISYRKSPCTWYTDTFHLQFPYGTLPQLHTQPSCTGDSNGKAWVIPDPADTNTYSFVWTNVAGDTLSLSDSLPAVSAGLYTVHVASSFCDTTLEIEVTEEDFRLMFYSNEFLCEDTDMQLQNLSGNHFTTFTWDFGNGTTSNLVQPVAHYADPGVYEITLTGSGSICKDTLKKQIIVDPQFPGAFSMDRDSICTGQSVAFLVAGDSSVQRLYWTIGDGTTFNTPYENSSSRAFDHAGRWHINLSTTYRACPATMGTDIVHVFKLPYVDLGPDTSLCLHGGAITLKNTAPEPEDPYHYSWSNGSSAARLEVVYPGTYTLTISTEPIGCSNTASIEVRKDCYIDVPNVFTPNNDGVNDYFFPRQLLSQSISSFEMSVYNRWGQVIFHTREAKGRGWDGRFNNTDQPAGVYIYTIKATIAGGRTEQYDGNVTLLR